jgi:hypothetical protein
VHCGSGFFEGCDSGSGFYCCSCSDSYSCYGCEKYSWTLSCFDSCFYFHSCSCYCSFESVKAFDFANGNKMSGCKNASDCGIVLVNVSVERNCETSSRHEYS